jgi:YhcH/YjgK/YiaL family protein
MKIIHGKISSSIKCPENIAKTVNLIRAADFSKLSIGSHNIGNFKFSIDEYETKDPSEKSAEQHKKFIDVQYILEGEESIGVSEENKANVVADPYNEEKDRTKFSKVVDEEFITLNKGGFAVFYPQDIHRPGCTVLGKKSKVKKVVVKLKFDN